MQVVIDIEKEIYEALKNDEVMISGLRSGKHLYQKILTAVATGTPLPKGHGRLGDLDKLEQRVSNYIDHNKYTMNKLTLQTVIRESIKGTHTIIEADKAESEG